jgi:glycerol-3-phosphate cytidylyltransferase-like family protein
MGLLTDFIEYERTWLITKELPNGGHYIYVVFEDDNGIKHKKGVRVSSEGGKAPKEVKNALAVLFKAMDKNGLNFHPDDEEEHKDVVILDYDIILDEHTNLCSMANKSGVKDAKSKIASMFSKFKDRQESITSLMTTCLPEESHTFLWEYECLARAIERMSGVRQLGNKPN